MLSKASKPFKHPLSIHSLYAELPQSTGMLLTILLKAVRGGEVVTM